MTETKTLFVAGPNPDRHWCAWRDGPERARVYGWGYTEAEAIADLERLEERGKAPAEKRVYPVLSDSEEDEREIEAMIATLKWRRLNPNEKPKP